MNNNIYTNKKFNLNPIAMKLINLINKDLTDELIRPVEEYGILAKDVYDRLRVAKLITVVENAGAGKSIMAGMLADLIDAECGQGYFKGMVFATNTRANRDAFLAKQTKFVKVKGITEIIADVAGDEVGAYANSLFDDEYDTSDKVLLQMYQNGDITKDQLNTIRVKRQENFKLMENNFICLCYAKITKGSLVQMMKSKVIVLDEMDAKNVVGLELGETIPSYMPGKNAITVLEEHHEHESEIRNFISEVFKREDTDGEIGGVVMMSAEKSLIHAIGDTYRINPRFQDVLGGIGVRHMGMPKTLVDTNLTIVIVPSTSSVAMGRNGKGEAKGEYTNERCWRNKITVAAREAGYKVICDGKVVHKAKADGLVNYSEVRMGDFTIEGCKGSNGLMDVDTCVIIGCPTPEEVGLMCLRTGMSAYEAACTIMSDKANQAIGRNTGYRQRGAKCLLVLPAKALEWADLGFGTGRVPNVVLDTITPYVHVLNCRNDAGEIADPVVREMFGKLMSGADYLVDAVTTHIVDIRDRAAMAGMAFQYPQKAFKEMVNNKFTELGVTARRIKDEKMVAVVIEKLEGMGMTKTKMDKIIDGKRTQEKCFAF